MGRYGETWGDTGGQREAEGEGGRARGGNHINPVEERENVTFYKKILRKSFNA